MNELTPLFWVLSAIPFVIVELMPTLGMAGFCLRMVLVAAPYLLLHSKLQLAVYGGAVFVYSILRLAVDFLTGANTLTDFFRQSRRAPQNPDSPDR